MLEEFRKFVLRGNVVDLAVGVVIGVAFGAIVASLVGDIIMPIVARLREASTSQTTISRSQTPCSGVWPTLTQRSRVL